MKTTLFLLLSSGMFLTACNKSAASKSSAGPGQPEARSTSDLDELMKLPDSARMMETWVYSKSRSIPEEAFEVAPPKVVVKRTSKNLYEVFAQYTATAKSDLYTSPPPQLVVEGGTTVPYTVVELLDRKGSAKVRYFQCQVRYSAASSGMHPDKALWNWELPKDSGDDIEIYQSGGFKEWATAEAFKINSDGTTSSDPQILIRGTPDHQKAVAKHPRLAKSEADRAQDRDQMGEDYKNAQKTKKQLEHELMEQLKSNFGQ
ncbi:MAG: hypothetical protein ABI600_08800 [Luteolibacter sp.]